MRTMLNVELLFSKGQKLARQGKLDESISIFNQALSMKPRYSGIFLHKALSLSKLKKYDEAINEIEEAIKLNPSNSVYYQFLGRIHYDFHQLDDALKAFDRSLELCPENILTLCFKNLTSLSKGGNIKEAYTILKKYINNTNSEFQGRFLVFCETFLRNNYQMAKPLEECPIITTHPSRIFQSGFMSDILSKLKLIPFKLEYYQFKIYYTVIHFFNSKKKQAYICYARAKQDKYFGNIDIAIVEYKKALESFSELHDAKKDLFELLLFKGDTKSACIYFKQLPNYEEICALFSLKNNAHKNGNDSKSNLYSKELPLIFNVCQFYYKTGNYEKAIKGFKFVSENVLKDPIPFYYLGLCYITKNDSDNAYLYFQQALQLVNPYIAERRLDEMMRLNSM